MSFLSNLLLKGIETPKFAVLSKKDNFEIRKYAPCIVAETVVQGNIENAGSNAFRTLAGYIFGNNANSNKISMTAPVCQQQIQQGSYAVQFTMPSEWTPQTLPRPNDPKVMLKVLPERTIAAIRYVGGWSQELFEENLARLMQEIKLRNLKPKAGLLPIWARYNSPFAPWFLRTNDILIELQ